MEALEGAQAGAGDTKEMHGEQASLFKGEQRTWRAHKKVRVLTGARLKSGASCSSPTESWKWSFPFAVFRRCFSSGQVRNFKNYGDKTFISC